MRKGIQTWVWISGGLMLIGGFGPWATVFVISVDGTQGDGWFVIAGGVLGAVLAYVRRTKRWAGAWPIAGGVVGVATTGYDRSHLERAISKGGAFAQALLHVGWGLELGLLASLSMVIAGIVGVVQGPEAEAAPPPLPTE